MDRSGRQDGPIEPPADPPGEPPIDPGALIEAIAERAAGHAAVELAIDPTFPARIGLPEPPFTAAVEALVAAAGPTIELCCGRMERVGDAGRRQVGLRVTVTGDAALADAPPDPWRALDGRLRVEPPTAGRVTVHGELWPPRVEEATPPLPKRLVGRALVVEDHPRVRAMLVHALEGAGHVCDAAPTFDEALRQLGACREGHALLVVDADLPTAPAPAAARVFAELAAQRGAVALVMGRHPDDAAPAIDKPLTRDRLAAALAAITAAREAAAREAAAREAAAAHADRFAAVRGAARDPADPDTAARHTAHDTAGRDLADRETTAGATGREAAARHASHGATGRDTAARHASHGATGREAAARQASHGATGREAAARDTNRGAAARDLAARDAAPDTAVPDTPPDTAAPDTTPAAARPPPPDAPAPAPERPAPATVVRIALDPALADLLPDFVRNRAADVHQLRAALATGDEATARRICHGIKGCGGAFGFPRLSALGAAIGQEARAGRLAATGPAIDELDHLVTAIAAAVGVELARE